MSTFMCGPATLLCMNHVTIFEHVSEWQWGWERKRRIEKTCGLSLKDKKGRKCLWFRTNLSNEMISTHLTADSHNLISLYLKLRFEPYAIRIMLWIKCRRLWNVIAYFSHLWNTKEITKCFNHNIFTGKLISST